MNTTIPKTKIVQTVKDAMDTTDDRLEIATNISETLDDMGINVKPVHHSIGTIDRNNVSAHRFISVDVFGEAAKENAEVIADALGSDIERLHAGRKYRVRVPEQKA